MAGEWKAQFESARRVYGAVVARRETGKLIKILGRAAVRCVEAPSKCASSFADEGHRVVVVHDKENLPVGQAEILAVVEFDVTTSHNDYNIHEVLSKLLPEGVTVPGAFETIGHIAHLNLLPEHEPHKYIIGDVILTKCPNLRTVVNKVHNLENEFRTCPFELLAGEPDYNTVHIENAFRFHIDYERVFWNSRLCGERARLCETIPQGSLVFDVMGGVGGFGVYLSRLNDCFVVSNDLNPAAYACAQTNIEVNKAGDHMSACNLDARKFIGEMISPRFTPSCLKPELFIADMMATLEATSSKRRRVEPRKVYFLMNLPATAISFLDGFSGVLDAVYAEDEAEFTLPVAMVYCFARPESFESEIRERVGAVLEHFEVLSITEVRNVAPSKRQYCVELRIPFATLLR